MQGHKMVKGVGVRACMEGAALRWKLLVDSIQGPGERKNLVSSEVFELEVSGLS